MSVAPVLCQKRRDHREGEKYMQCRECHAELPQGARRCPQCGRPVLHEKIWRNKRLRALLIGIAIVLVAVGAGLPSSPRRTPP